MVLAVAIQNSDIKNNVGSMVSLGCETPIGRHDNTICFHGAKKRCRCDSVIGQIERWRINEAGLIDLGGELPR
jgi:hypothetical protein